MAKKTTETSPYPTDPGADTGDNGESSRLFGGTPIETADPPPGTPGQASGGEKKVKRRMSVKIQTLAKIDRILADLPAEDVAAVLAWLNATHAVKTVAEAV